VYRSIVRVIVECFARHCALFAGHSVVIASGLRRLEQCRQFVFRKGPPVVDPAPRTTRYSSARILDDFVKFGRFRGRLGNLETRLATVNEITGIEARGLIPETEFFIRGIGPGTRGLLVPDIAVQRIGSDIPVEFV